MTPYLGLGLLQSRTEWLPGEVGLGSSCPGKQKTRGCCCKELMAANGSKSRRALLTARTVSAGGQGAVRAACLSVRPCACCVSWIWVTFRPGSWNTWLHRSAPGRECSHLLPSLSPWPCYNGSFTDLARIIKEEHGGKGEEQSFENPHRWGKNAHKTWWRPSVPSMLVMGGDVSLRRGEMPPEGGSEMVPSVPLLQPSAACWECQWEAVGWGWGKELWGWHKLLSPLAP